MKNQSFRGAILREAIEATFKRRSTEIPFTTLPVALTDEFHSLPDKQMQWTGFLRKSKLEPLDFGTAIQRIGSFLLPVMKGEVGNHEWHPETGWTKQPS